MAKSFLHFRTTGAAYPGEESSLDDVERFRALAKVPAEGTPEAYGLTIPENATEQDKALYAELSDVAHKNHMPQPAFNALVAAYQEAQENIAAEMQKQIDGQKQADQDALVSKWRGDYQVNKSTVSHYTANIARETGLDPESPEIQALVDFPAYNELMLQVSKMATKAEDGFRQPVGTGDLRSPGQVLQSISDGSHPIHGKAYTDPNASDEQRRAAYQEFARLSNLAAGQ